MNKLAINIIILFCCNISIAQDHSLGKQQIREVFDNLVSAYGSAKSPPQLKIISDNEIQKTPAIYFASPSPTIKVDIHLFNLCKKFGIDQRNAISIVISHELAHYYNDHTFCTDFAFAIRNQNKELSGKLKALSKTEKIALETEADHKGLFYSCMAGYTPFNVYPKLLDEIYRIYELADIEIGYPTKSERKAISTQARNKINTLYPLFLDGISAIEKEDYDKAIYNFETLNNYFPSRENYNNLGVSKVLKAIKYKPFSREASKYPDRFKYPISIDKISRLKHPSKERSIEVETNYDIEKLLKSAQKDFEKAISLDVNYTKSYINLACTFDLLENPMAAIGKIHELPKRHQNNFDSKLILAISYFHADMKTKAEEIYQSLKL